MIEFHRKRDFGGLIGDTFKFLKVYGRNYFTNYFLINGLLLILLVVLAVFGYKELFAQIMGSNTQGQQFFFEQYFQENQLVLVGVFGLTFLLFLLFSIINYAYPVFYMIRVGDRPNTKVTMDNILTDLKSNLGKLLILFLGLTFVVAPLSFILVGITYALVFILIGIPLLMVVLPTIVNVINFIFYNMLHAKKGFFSSLSMAIRSQFSYPHHAERSPFWKYVGSTLIMYIIIQVVSSIFTMIPAVMIGFTAAVNPESMQGASQNPFEGTLGIVFFVLYGVALLVSLILSNLLYINAGFLYFDSRTDLHRKKDLEAIDSIGQQDA